MIKNLIFDFGDVFINLDKQGAFENALGIFKLKEFPEEMVAINTLYEQGLIDTDEFLGFYKQNFKHLNTQEIIDAWNYILKDIPVERFEFIRQLSENKEYRLFLLSNTNKLHIEWVKENVPFYQDFKSCFEQFYLSYEILMRKPNADIFNFVLNENNLLPKESFFVDDTKENTDMADSLGIKTWTIDESREDIIHLFETKKDLF